MGGPELNKSKNAPEANDRKLAGEDFKKLATPVLKEETSLAQKTERALRKLEKDHPELATDENFVRLKVLSAKQQQKELDRGKKGRDGGGDSLSTTSSPDEDSRIKERTPEAIAGIDGSVLDRVAKESSTPQELRINTLRTEALTAKDDGTSNSGTADASESRALPKSKKSSIRMSELQFGKSERSHTERSHNTDNSQSEFLEPLGISGDKNGELRVLLPSWSAPESWGSSDDQLLSEQKEKTSGNIIGRAELNRTVLSIFVDRLREQKGNMNDFADYGRGTKKDIERQELNTQFLLDVTAARVRELREEGGISAEMVDNYQQILDTANAAFTKTKSLRPSPEPDPIRVRYTKVLVAIRDYVSEEASLIEFQIEKQTKKPAGIQSVEESILGGL